MEAPLIAFCENNLYAVETFIGRSAAGTSITDRASGFGLPAVQVDGQDVGAVYRAVREARDRAAQGGGPTFIEAQTYRYYGHNTGEVVTYRTAEEVETWKRQRTPSNGSGTDSPPHIESIGSRSSRARLGPR